MTALGSVLGFTVPLVDRWASVPGSLAEHSFPSVIRTVQAKRRLFD